MKKLLLLLVSLTLFTVILAGCGSNNENAENNTNTEEDTEALSEESLKIGVVSGPDEQNFEVVKELAAEDGLELELVSFSDYIMPNTALAEGEVDLNSYQHEPFLNEYNEDHNTDLVPVFKTYLSAIGVYSNEIEDIEDTPEGATVGIPNDPSNGSRALVLFEEAGLIKIDEDARDSATPSDIVENERNLEFTELEAAQLPTMLDEVDLAVINGNFAVLNGLDPSEDTIYLESSDSPYVNVVVAREENKDDPVIDQIKEYYQSDEVKEFMLDEYDGADQPAW